MEEYYCAGRVDFEAQREKVKEYRAARKFFEAIAPSQPEIMRGKLETAIAALLEGEERCKEESHNLTYAELKGMHAQPVYLGSYAAFVDARRDLIRILDHDSSTWDIPIQELLSEPERLGAITRHPASGEARMW